MRNLIIVALSLSFVGLIFSSSAAQNRNASARAQEIVAFFNKRKHVVKEKRGIRVEKFLEIRSAPDIKHDARAYAGTYLADPSYSFHLSVGADGRVEAHGTEPSPVAARSFTLKNARIEGALLTGTKVYSDGATEPFEGVFISRREFHSPTDEGTTSFGLGIYFDPPKVGEGFMLSRLFYERRQ